MLCVKGASGNKRSSPTDHKLHKTEVGSPKPLILQNSEQIPSISQHLVAMRNPPRRYTSPTCPTTRQTDGVVAELRRRDDEILHAAASELKFNFFFFFFRLLHDDWTAAVRIGFPPLFLFLFLYDWIKSGPCRFGTNRLEATSIVLCKSAK